MKDHVYNHLAAGIVADAGAGLAALAAGLEASGFQPPEPRTGEIRGLLDEWWRDNQPPAESDRSPIHPARLMREVRQVMDADTILVSDASTPYM